MKFITGRSGDIVNLPFFVESNISFICKNDITDVYENRSIVAISIHFNKGTTFRRYGLT